MSTLKIEIVQIDNILPHENADKLELAVVKGWQCVVQKGEYKVGDKAVYFPIDSILPNKLEAKLFGPDSKVKLNKGRIKTIKLRGAVSQGLLAKLEYAGLYSSLTVGQDVTTLLGVTKYEPPMPEERANLSGKRTLKPKVNPNFKKYTDIENIKHYPDIFKEGEIVYCTEKVHGTNFRAGYVPNTINSFKKRVMSWLHLLPNYEFVYGSHNVQLQERKFKAGKNIIEDVYSEAVNKYQLKKRLKEGEVVYGEVYGDGIQKGYTYGCGKEEHRLVLFDVMKDGNYLDVDEFFFFCQERNLPSVTKLYKGPYNLDKIKSLIKGNSKMHPMQKIMEGTVIKPLKEECGLCGRKVLKLISDDYLLQKDLTEYH